MGLRMIKAQGGIFGCVRLEACARRNGRRAYEPARAGAAKEGNEHLEVHFGEGHMSEAMTVPSGEKPKLWTPGDWNAFSASGPTSS